jgi:outer membrane protein
MPVFRKVILLFLAVFSLFYLYPSFAALKIAVVDDNKILTDIPQISAMQDHINNQFAPKSEAIDILQRSLSANVNKLADLKIKASVKERKKLREKILEQHAKMHLLQADLQKKIAAMQKEYQETISKQIEDTITDIAKDRGINLVLHKENAFYLTSDYDLTQSVIDVLKEKF